MFNTFLLTATTVQNESKVSPLPIIMLILCLLGGIGYLLYQKVIIPRKIQKEEQEEENAKQSTWEFINVKDIGENGIYTVDNKIISIYRIEPINIDLMTDEEKMSAINSITASISGIKEPYKILSIQKPFDIKPYRNALLEKAKQESDPVRKSIMFNEISSLNELGSKKEIPDRQSFIVYWNDNNKKYLKKRAEFEKFFNNGEKNNLSIKIELLNTNQLMRLCNMVYNPSFSVKEFKLDNSVPFINI